MNYKYILSLFALLLLFPSTSLDAQLLKKLKKTVQNEAENTVNRKARQKTRETVEGAMDGKPNDQNPNTNTKQNPNDPSEQPSATAVDADGNPVSIETSEKTFESYSKFDFIPGEQIIHFDNFERTEIGDFPTGWNTLGSAEVVTTNTTEGKWLKVTNGTGGIIPYDITDFPENFTLEMDIMFDFPVKDYAYQRNLHLIFTSITDPEHRVNSTHPGRNQVIFELSGGISYGANAKFGKMKDGKSSTGTKVELPNHFQDEFIGEKKRVSIWRQGKRVRMYLDNQKLYDVPLAWSGSEPIGGFRLLAEMSNENEHYYISNLRMAVGKPDTRSKLITEGRLVTYGITFNTNSDIVRPESYGTLKKIAAVLKENPSVKIQIIGHTDGDGSADYNQGLSEKRAISVKQSLITKFEISGDRLQTTGMGESKPIGDNETSSGKAQNRRVELVKID